jgi:Fe-S-cluster containining protein
MKTASVSKNQDWWKSGVVFQCQGSGKCCTSHGEYGFVYMTKKDRSRMAKHLGLTLIEFTKKHCDRTDGFFHLKEDPKNPDCLFLKNKRCTVYEARPTQCRTWPFWPDTMSAKAWKADVVNFCPGVGKGSKITAEQIEKQFNEQQAAEEALDQEAREFLLKKS